MGIYLVVSLSHISILPSQLCRQPHTLATKQYLSEKRIFFSDFKIHKQYHLGVGKIFRMKFGRLMRLLKRFCKCFEFQRRKAVLNILRFVSLTIKSVRCAKSELNIFAESFHNICLLYFLLYL